jgi:hypothetical protein
MNQFSINSNFRRVSPFAGLISLGMACLTSLVGCTSQPSQPARPNQTAQPAATTPATPTPPRTPLTLEKLKNARYYFLAKGPIQLRNGTYQDPNTQQTIQLGEVMAYGKLNSDEAKDAVATLRVTIPKSGEFDYLVFVVDDNGTPKNISAEFLGPRTTVQSIKIKPDSSTEVVLKQYQAGDPDCCPSREATRTYKLRT